MFDVPGFKPHGGQSGREAGKELRHRVPRGVHAEFSTAADRPGVVEVVERTNAGRLPELVPIRIGRMAANPFAFLRGSAALMAADLAVAPVTGITAQICGDAHAGNFGVFGTPEGNLVMDVNDFDETVPGPWEWDLKRLTASIVVAGRVGGAPEDVCREAAYDAAAAYRQTMVLLGGLPVFEAWRAIADESLVSHADAHDLSGLLKKVAKKARKNTSAKVAAKSTVRTESGLRRFVPEPPVLTLVDETTAAAVAHGLTAYVDTLSPQHRPLLARHSVHDVAFRVVGTGSVGLRAYVVLLEGCDGEALVLQVKEARPSALAPYLAVADYAHEGERIVLGQKLMQSVGDILLGWTTVQGRHFMVRQFRNMKGSIDASTLPSGLLDDYARMTGALLARAHSHSADPELLAGYCGTGDRFEQVFGEFAVAYADQTEKDYEQLLTGVKSGRLPAEHGV